MDPLLILLIGVVIVIGGILVFRLHAFLALTLAGLTVAMITPVSNLQGYAEYMAAKGKWNDARQAAFVKDAREKSPAERFAVELGSTAGKIAVLIAMAAIIGKCLLDSGAADRIVRSALKLVGQPRAPLAFLGSGFLLGIPVFFDTVFYLMIPLGKAMRLRTGGNYTLYVLSIVAGATMAHSLVPPTPGPLLVAAELNINLGVMILGGCAVGLVTAFVGYAWAVFANSIWQVPLRETADASLDELEALAKRDESELPPAWLAVLPILLPVLLITAWTGLEAWLKSQGLKPTSYPEWSHIVQILGDKNIALTLAAAIALMTLAWQKKSTFSELSAAVGTALASGGVIILITSAGGGFGGVLRQTGIAERIEGFVPEAQSLWLLPIAFLVTTAVRTAQGSATVAMITSVSIIAPIVTTTTGLGFNPVYIALAIGCGSKPLAWMNDSGFWVICKMSGMTETEGLKLVTPMSAAMGIVGLGVVMLGAWLMPLAG